MGDHNRAAVLREAGRDVRGFLAGHFTLTDGQRVELASIRDADIQALQNTLNRAASENAPLRVAIESHAGEKRQGRQEVLQELQEEMERLREQVAEAEAAAQGSKHVRLYLRDDDPSVDVAILAP